MTREEMIKELKTVYLGDSIKMREAKNMAIEALEQEPCEDCISRQAVLDTIDKWVKSMHVLIALHANEVTPLFESVHDLPPVTPQQKMGHWEKRDVRGQRVDCCSVCGLSNGTIYEYNYCPNCGAKMQEVEE